MILVDTSVWIDLLNSRFVGSLPDSLLLQLAVCPPVIQELLQGLKEGQRSRVLEETLLAFPCIEEEVPLIRYREAAIIYRSGRKKGFTIRSSVDSLIAAIAIHHSIPVWHRDRDFSAIAQFTVLDEFNPS